MSRCAVLLMMVLAGRADASPAQPEDVPLPAAEPTVKVAEPMPGVAAFDLPAVSPGFVNPRYLRVAGRKLLDTKVAVKGYVIWVYSCVEQVRLPKEPAAKTQKRIDADPTICERPKLYLGNSPKTPIDRGLWVVSVPRLPNKLEKQRLPKEELKNWPKVPKFKVGDYVVINGDFKVRSPHGEVNTDGLVVFESMTPAKPDRVAVEPHMGRRLPDTIERTAPVLKPARLALIEPTKRGASIAAMKNGTLALGQRKYADAMKAYRDAVLAWPQNHSAWYGLGGSLAAQSMWEAAHEAFGKAVAVHPESAMYQMWLGVSAYEKAVQLARVNQSKAAGVRPDQISVDLTTINFDAALAPLETAVSLDASLWRAHFYLGRVYRAADRTREAAMEFSDAAKLRADEPGPWIALGELYRKWDNTVLAIDLMTLATKSVRADASAADVHYVLAMAHDDNDDFPKAIESYTKTLELMPDHGKALFQRGQVYFKTKKYAEAKADLEAFTKLGTGPDLATQQANKMLVDIAMKPAPKKKK